MKFNQIVLFVSLSVALCVIFTKCTNAEETVLSDNQLAETNYHQEPEAYSDDSNSQNQEDADSDDEQADNVVVITRETRDTRGYGGGRRDCRSNRDCGRGQVCRYVGRSLLRACQRPYSQYY